jgi:hypothetical protein
MGAKRRRVKSTQDSLFQDLKSNRRGFPDTSYGPSSSKSTQRTSDKWNTSDDELVEVGALFSLNYKLHPSNL